MLDAALGLTSVYLLLAMFCSTANEWIAALFAMRSGMLENGVAHLLGEMSKEFYEHPLIQGLMLDGRHPERLAASTFAKAVVDLATPNRSAGACFEDLKRGIDDLPPGRLRNSLLPLVKGCDARIESAHRAIENWFDGAMGELSRRYKRRAQFYTALLAVGITVATNADTLRLTRALLSGQDGNAALGWSGPPCSWPQMLAGWVLTVAAVSLGAPFWFDVARNVAAAARPEARREG